MILLLILKYFKEKELDSNYVKWKGNEISYVIMWLYVYVYVCKLLFVKLLDMTLLRLQWYRDDVAFGACLNIDRGFGPCV